MDKNEIVSRLKAKLEETKLPQAWAARQVGVTPSYFNRVMLGVLVPGDELCERLNKLLVILESSGLTEVV